MVLAFPTIAAEKVPPEASAYLTLKGREAKAGSIAVEAQGLGYTDCEALEYPETLTTILNAEDGLKGKVRSHFAIFVEVTSSRGKDIPGIAYMRRDLSK